MMLKPPGLIPLTFCFYVISGIVVLYAGQNSVRAESSPVTSEAQIKRGKLVYLRFCSYCHGRNLEGEADWRTRKPDGKLPAPPHDESGHTWHHPDSVLFSITKFGMIPPNAPQGYKSDMPGWKDTLSDDDIRAVLIYIKSTWPQNIRETQDEINQQSLKNR